jgi:Spy/CpxP family protein refolding chaperone
MKLAMISAAALAMVLLSAGVAAADMQPIPNPPESHHMPHHGHHHVAKHHHHHKKG